MLHRASGTWAVLLLAALHGCAPATPEPMSPRPVETVSSIRRIEHPVNRSVSLVLDPIDVDAGPIGGRLRLGGMYVENRLGGPDGGAVLVVQIDRATADPVFTEGAVLHIEADGLRLPTARVGPDRLHRTRRTGRGWRETILIPVEATDLRRMANARRASVHLSAGPTLVVDRRLKDGLRDLLRRLPEAAFTRSRATRASTLQSEPEASPSTQPR